MSRSDRERLRAAGVHVFATCPPSHACDAQRYGDEVVRVARWSEAAGCRGLLLYTDNRLVDPWLLACDVIRHTTALRPLVAVQPAYLHPYAAAKMVASIAFLTGRRVCLNMVAGGFKNDLEALGDATAHDERYERLVEYTTLVLALLRADAPVTMQGRFYRVKNLTLAPALPPGMLPEVFVSGSSEAGVAAARAVGAIAVRYPLRAAQFESDAADWSPRMGIRVGIVARGRSREAWSAARARFPDDRKGRLTHQLATKLSDSEWHKQLSAVRDAEDSPDDPYWMLPFQTYGTFCPYLVGAHARVAEEIARYVRAGCRTFIVDVPASAEELRHIGIVFERAAELVPL